MRPVSVAVLLGACVVIISGCGSNAGPAPLADGSYRAYATASGPADVPQATLDLAGSEVTIAEFDVIQTAQVGSPADAQVLCPPDGTGQPVTLTAPITLGSTTYARPAMFGDCGETTPRRVTVVDLDSYTDGDGLPPYARWTEFCDTTDPDC